MDFNNIQKPKKEISKIDPIKNFWGDLDKKASYDKTIEIKHTDMNYKRKS